jgi:hypothetical protein
MYPFFGSRFNVSTQGLSLNDSTRSSYLYYLVLAGRVGWRDPNEIFNPPICSSRGDLLLCNSQNPEFHMPEPRTKRPSAVSAQTSIKE